MSRSFRQWLQSFIGELKRRHVTQVMFAYALIGFGLMQAASGRTRTPDATVGRR